VTEHIDALDDEAPSVFDHPVGRKDFLFDGAKLVAAAAAAGPFFMAGEQAAAAIQASTSTDATVADPIAKSAVDAAKKSVSIDAKVAPRKLPQLAEVYPIEVIACFAHPKGQKAHETVVTIEAKPSDVHKALESVGLKPGKPAKRGVFSRLSARNKE